MEEKKYRKQMDNLYVEKTRELCKTLPLVVTKYIRNIQYTTTSMTRYEYVKNIGHFMDYICETYIEMPIDKPQNISIEILGNLNKDFFEDYLDYLQKYRKNNKEYSNTNVSIKRKLSALRNFFSYLYEEELISSNPIMKIALPVVKEKEIIFMEENEAADLLDVVEYGNALTKKQSEYHEKLKERDLAIIHLLLSTGIRVSELVGLNLNDVDFDKCKVHVVRKGNKDGTVYFNDEAAEYLLDYYEKRKRMSPLEEHKDALFLSTRHKRISVRSVETLVKKYARIAVPLKHITPHKLRSTYATTFYSETGDIYLLAENLGHSDIETTSRHYANLKNSRKEENRNKVSFKRR